MKSKIKLLVMDVDGTLTDGKVYMGADGEAVKRFDIKDGHGVIHILPKLDITPVIITGRKSEILLRRCEEMHITEIHQNIQDKKVKMKEVMQKYAVTKEQVAYIGDDINDLECMEMSGLTACPSDAVEEVKAAVDYICKAEGGNGAVREFIDYLNNMSRQKG